MTSPDAPSPLRPLLPGALVFIAGLAIWFATAGLLFMLALPVMALGTFLLLFAALIMKPSPKMARACAVFSALVAAAILGLLLWPAGVGA